MLSIQASTTVGIGDVACAGTAGRAPAAPREREQRLAVGALVMQAQRRPSRRRRVDRAAGSFSARSLIPTAPRATRSTFGHSRMIGVRPGHEAHVAALEQHDLSLSSLPTSGVSSCVASYGAMWSCCAIEFSTGHGDLLEVDPLARRSPARPSSACSPTSALWWSGGSTRRGTGSGRSSTCSIRR